jgi:predicted DNA-binding transcriptional regulator YafY
MTEVQRAEATDLARRIWLRSPAASPRLPSAKVVDEALRQRVALSIDYVGALGQRSSRRVVEPLALANTGGHWYLLAWCRKRVAGRWFRLDRIRAARLTREACVERDLRAVFGEPPADAQPVKFRVAW